MVRTSLWIAIATCLCLVFVGSALASLQPRTDNPTRTMEQAIAPYVGMIGRYPDGVYPGSPETVLTWGMRDPIVLIVRRFDETGWRVIAFYRDRKQTVPSEWTAMWVQAVRQSRNRARPIDPWGNPITDMNVLHPEERW